MAGNRFIPLFFLTGLLFACSSGPEKGVTIGNPNPVRQPPAKSSGAAKKKSGIFFGNSFRPQSRGDYKLLLESCLRCGRKQLCGGTYHKQIFSLTRNDPQLCDGWISEGFIQIEFKEKKLPTEAIVTIQPKHSRIGWGYWGRTAAFAAKARAYPINKNRGFAIDLNRGGGLGGQYPLKIKSEDSNHVKQSSLSVEAEYGPPSGGNIIIEEDLPLLRERAVAPPKATCRQCVRWNNL